VRIQALWFDRKPNLKRPREATRLETRRTRSFFSFFPSLLLRDAIRGDFFRNVSLYLELMGIRAEQSTSSSRGRAGGETYKEGEDGEDTVEERAMWILSRVFARSYKIERNHSSQNFSPSLAVSNRGRFFSITTAPPPLFFLLMARRPTFQSSVEAR